MNLRALFVIAALSATGAMISFIVKLSEIAEDPTLLWGIWWGATALGAGIASRQMHDLNRGQPRR